MSGVAIDLEGTSHAFMALEKDMGYNLNCENIDNNDRKNADIGIGIGNNDDMNDDANNKNNKNNYRNKNNDKNDADNKINNNSSQNKFSIIESINMARKRKKKKEKERCFVWKRLAF